MTPGTGHLAEVLSQCPPGPQFSRVTKLLGLLEISMLLLQDRVALIAKSSKGSGMGQAKNWLEKAFEVGNPRKIKLLALEDPDLEPLWAKIGET
jgi:hypothetical protein